MSVCIFCFNRPPPGLRCTYDLHHEYPEPPTPEKKTQTPKIDVNRCVHCGLHAKNPLSQTNGCGHMYPNVPEANMTAKEYP